MKPALLGLMLALITLPALPANPTVTATTMTTTDPYLWLEDVTGDRAMAWVHARNAESRAVLETYPRFQAMRDGFRAILDSRDKIPHFSRRGDALYNFWRDAAHPRGLWRRTTLAEFRQPAPAWETVIDLDALALAEGENWVWGGATCLGPAYQHCLVQLSRGGADATVVREFDSRSKRFIADGFMLPEAKSDVAWASADALFVGTDFGPGSLTDSGYPRLIKRWQRGQPLSEAVTVFEARPQDVAASVSVELTPGFERTVFSRATDFYNSEQFLLVGQQLQKINIPSDAVIGFWRERALLQLRSDWPVGATRWPAGALLVGDANAVLAAADAAAMPPLQALFTPTATRSLAGWSTTRSQVLLNVLDNVAGKLEAWRPDTTGGGWLRRDIAAPFPGTLSAHALHEPLLAQDALAEAFTLTYADFVTPDSLMLGDAAPNSNAALATLKAQPAHFDASGVRVEQRFATSKDGTRVPYFIVWPPGATADAANPTLL